MKAGWPSTKLYWPQAVDYMVHVVDELGKTGSQGSLYYRKVQA